MPRASRQPRDVSLNFRPVGYDNSTRPSGVESSLTRTTSTWTQWLKSSSASARTPWLSPQVGAGDQVRQHPRVAVEEGSPVVPVAPQPPC